MAVAGNLLGDDRPYAPVPYCWTDQYDARVQAYGIFPADAEITVLHGELARRRFVAGELRTLRQLVVDGVPARWIQKAQLINGPAQECSCLC